MLTGQRPPCAIVRYLTKLFGRDQIKPLGQSLRQIKLSKGNLRLAHQWTTGKQSLAVDDANFQFTRRQIRRSHRVLDRFVEYWINTVSHHLNEIC